MTAALSVVREAMLAWMSQFSDPMIDSIQEHIDGLALVTDPKKKNPQTGRQLTY
jgi:hypothetical protein